MEDYFALSRNGHLRKDTYNPETNTLDIVSDGLYPANVLSNMCDNSFCLDNVECGSMEGFLQSLKYLDFEKQLRVCAMKGGRAKKMSTKDWMTDQMLWWQGCPIFRHSAEFQNLIRQAYRAMYEQNERFRTALRRTMGKVLVHKRGEHDPFKTILTDTEFCEILTELRDSILI